MDIDNKANRQQVGDRLRQFLKFNFEGNQSKLARHIRQSQAVVNRLLRGAQLPSSKFLFALGQYTNIDVNWLLSGNGKMTRETEYASGHVSFLKTHDRIEGMPNPSSRCICIPYPSRGSKTLYAYVVSQDDEVTRWDGSDISAGDALLLETDPEFFPKDKKYSGLFLISNPKNNVLQFAIVNQNHGGLTAETQPKQSAVHRYNLELVVPSSGYPSLKVAGRKDDQRITTEKLTISRRNLIAYCVSVYRNMENFHCQPV